MSPTFTKAYHGPGYPKAEPPTMQFKAFETGHLMDTMSDLLTARHERSAMAIQFMESAERRWNALNEGLDNFQFKTREPVPDSESSERARETAILQSVSDPMGAILRDSDGMRVQSIMGFKEEFGCSERTRDWSEFKSAKEIWEDYARIKAAGNP